MRSVHGFNTGMAQHSHRTKQSTFGKVVVPTLTTQGSTERK